MIDWMWGVRKQEMGGRPSLFQVGSKGWMVPPLKGSYLNILLLPYASSLDPRLNLTTSRSPSLRLSAMDMRTSKLVFDYLLSCIVLELIYVYRPSRESGMVVKITES